jgi:endonuclease-3
MMGLNILKMDKALLRRFGERVLRPHNDPVGEMVRTILSQNTSDHNRDLAYARLISRYHSWEKVADARIDSIKRAIKPGGLSAVKAPRIRKTLRQIRNGRDRVDLSGIKKMTVDEGIAYLTSFDGVGVKTAACVMLFSFGKNVFPVDTHIYRVTRRLGLIEDGLSREKAFVILNDLIPPELAYRLHLNLIQLGREICKPRNPKCGECVLFDVCPSAGSFSKSA